jgi:hypothetical protein
MIEIHDLCALRQSCSQKDTRTSISGSVFRRVGDFVRWEVFQQLQNPATLHAVCGNMTRPFSATYGVLTIEGNDVSGDIFEVK